MCSGVFVHLDIKQLRNSKNIWDAHELRKFIQQLHFDAPVRRLPELQGFVCQIKKKEKSWKLSEMWEEVI